MKSKKADLTLTQILLILGAIIFVAVVIYFLIGPFASGVQGYTKTNILPFGR